MKLFCGIVGACVFTATALASARAQTAPPLEVVVRERRAVEAPTLETRVGGEEGRRGAGTQDDAIKALQALPGLARSGAGAGEIIAWGSAPRETRLYVDGVEVPVLYHGSGIRSVLPSGWVARLGVVPGAHGPEHGRGLGGLVAIETRRLDAERWHLSAQLDPLDAAVAASVPLSGSVALAVAGRQGHVDRWLPRVAGGAARLLSVPSYRDGQAKLRVALADNESLELVCLRSRDALQRASPSSDPNGRIRERRELEFARLYLRYVRADREDRVEVTPFVGIDRSLERLSARDGRSRLAQRQVLYGVRASETFSYGDAASLRLGIDAQGRFSALEREGSLTLPAREGDPFVWGQLPGSDQAFDAFAVHGLDVAPYAELRLRHQRLTLAAGLRLDTYLIESDRVRPRLASLPPVGRSRAWLAPEPRLTLEYELDARSRLVAAAGLQHQAPDAQDLSATFGNPELSLARSWQLSAGEHLRFGPSTSLELLGFYKQLERLATRSALSTPSTAQVLVSSGAGRSFGVQLLVRQTLSAGWSGWLAATLSRSERVDDDGTERLFDHDQPLVLAAVLNKRVGDWSFGARVRYASGSPRTPVIGARYDLGSDRYEPRFGPRNTGRLPAFFQADLRVDRRFELSAEARLVLYADALNVSVRQNPEEIVYGADYRERDYLLGLPTLLVIGARLER